MKKYMLKVDFKRIGEKLFPWVLAIVITLVCVGYKHGSSLLGETDLVHIKDSLSVNNLRFDDSSSLKNVYFEAKGREFTSLLNYFCEKNQNVEIVSVTRDVSGNPMETIGYRVVFKWCYEH